MKKYQYLCGVLHNCGLSISELDLQPRKEIVCDCGDLDALGLILDSGERLDAIVSYNRMPAAVFVSFLVGKYIIVGAAVTQKQNCPASLVRLTDLTLLEF